MDAPTAFDSDRLLWPEATTAVPGPDVTTVTTPLRPDFWDGNVLLLRAAPAPGAWPLWTAQWRERVQQVTGARHGWFQWEAPLGLPNAVPAPPGYLLEANTLLVQAPRPARGTGWPVTALTSDSDWQKALELLALDAGEAGAPGDFLRWQWSRYRERTRAGQGRWLGCWDGTTLTGMVGVLTGGGMARFQQVLTHPAYRRRAIATSLLEAQLEGLLARPDVSRAFIVAEEGSAPGRLYRSLGFEPLARRLAAHAPVDEEGP